MRLAATAIISAAILSTGSAHATLAISDDATSNVQCSGGTCTATAADAVLNTTELANLLANRDVTVKTASGANTIAATASFSWVSKRHLTLLADQGVDIRAPVVVAGKGGVAITTGSGELTFSSGGKIQFWDTRFGTLSINGASYILVASVQALANAAQFSTPIALANDYDATPDGTYTFAPVRRVDVTLEGLGNTISNFHVREQDTAGTPRSVGLIAQNFGTIRDFHVVGSSAKGGAAGMTIVNVGLLAGYSGGTIAHSSTSGEVGQLSPARIGGLVGQNSGLITDSQSDATVRRGQIMGGLVGINLQGTISHSHAGGIVKEPKGASTNIGGLVGQNEAQSTITLSYSTATVQGISRHRRGDRAGGLLGFADSGTVSLCFAQGAVSGGDVVGGLIGFNAGRLSNSYAMSPLDGLRAADMGGVAGNGSSVSNISQVYAAGAFTVERRKSLGGIMGFEFNQGQNVFADAYWDLDSTTVTDPADGVGNIPNRPGTTGLTHAQITSALPSGFDPAIWARDDAINGGYPYLTDNPPPQ